MLPAEAVFPIFYAVNLCDMPIGTTVHLMSESLRQGIPIIQKN